MSIARVCAALAALASLVLPLLVRADPPQPAATGLFLPSGTQIQLVTSEPIDSASTAPGTIVSARLRAPLLANGRTVAGIGSSVDLRVTETRPASPGVDGAIFLRVLPLRLADGTDLPIALPHYALTPRLVAAWPEQIALPNRAVPQKLDGDLVLPAGTVLQAMTAATVDASNPQKNVVMTPPPFAVSTDHPFSAFTPIPMATYNPVPIGSGNPRRRGERRRPPSPSPSPSATPSPTPTPSPSPS